MAPVRPLLPCLLLLACACRGSDDSHAAEPTATSEPAVEQLFPDVLAVKATREESGTWRFDVTLSSPYDSPERYADAWRVLGPEGEELGVRILTHDHANDQPFTRSLSGVAIPDGVDVIVVQGRDQVSGWGGETVEVRLER